MWRHVGKDCPEYHGDLNAFIPPAGEKRCINGANNPNAPTAGTWYYVETIRHSNSGNYYATQTATEFWDNSKRYNRLLINGSWSAWAEAGSTMNTSEYAISQTGVGTNSINIGAHKACFLSRFYVSDGQESSDKWCQVYPSGGIWILLASLGWNTPGVYTTQCYARCIDG